MKKKFYVMLSACVLAAGLCAGSVSAQPAAYTQPTAEILSAFRQYAELNFYQGEVPTVIEVPLGNIFLERNDVAVLNLETQNFEPVYFKEQIVQSAVSASSDISLNQIVDGNVNTFEEFPVPGDSDSVATINVTGNNITSTSLTLLLDRYVALPKTVQIQVMTSAGMKIVVAERPLEGNTIYFPKTTANTWIVTLRYSQPLRIAELRLNQEQVQNVNRVLRFLAQPKTSYRIYFDTDRVISVPVGESGNLALDQGVRSWGPIKPISNPLFKIADSDSDTIPDIKDNCISVANRDQKDTDGNSRGDVCDDFDRDGLPNIQDNCPDQPNLNQSDADGDSLGDVCDPDESRITEQHKWLPWAGMGIAALVLITLFFLTATSMRNNKDDIVLK